MTDDPIKECPECKGPVVRLLSAGTGLIFKGSGFYITDYKSNPNSATSTPSNDSKKTGAQSETPAGETKSTSKDTQSKASKPESKDTKVA